MSQMSYDKATMAARSKLPGSKMTFDPPARASVYVGAGGPAATRRRNSCLCSKSIAVKAETGSPAPAAVTVRPARLGTKLERGRGTNLNHSPWRVTPA